MMKKFTLILAALFTVVTASAQTTITGTVKNGKGMKLRLHRYIAGGMEKMDSTIADGSGKFSFSFQQTETGFYRLSRRENDFIALACKPGEKIILTADSSSLNRTYTVKGSEYSAHMLEFALLVNTFVKDKDTLSVKFKKALAAGNTQESDAYGKKMSERYDKFVKDRNAFLTKRSKSPATFAAVSHLNPQTDFDQFKQIQAAMKASMPGSAFTQYIDNAVLQVEKAREEEARQKKEQERLAEIQSRFGPGKPIPEISMADTTGKKNITLSSLKGKYVLVDFWASWCGPCRMENPNVVALYNKYKDKGFTVYSVSLDDRMEPWKAAIKKDGLAWPNHVSELKKWNTSVLGTFGITGIPYTVLIDKEGKIIQTHLRGQALEQKLKEIFGF